MIRCASVNRTLNPGPTRIDPGPGSEGLICERDHQLSWGVGVSPLGGKS